MKIKQFKDEALAHYSYAIISDGKMALVDPARNPLPYYELAEAENAKIVAVFETHPHADFVSSHLQIHEEKGATIFASKLLGAEYPHQTFDDGDSFKMGTVLFKARNTPGHSPDSITVIAESGGETILFTGDTLFIGNVGRPDLRETVGNVTAQRVELAKAMYDTIQNKFSDLPDEAVVYPAHGAGSLCGKNMSSAASSTLGDERKNNWAFRAQTEAEFVEEILKDQPFVPAYFGFNVDLNKKGAENVQKTISEIANSVLREKEGDAPVVDVRDGETFKKHHLPNSINIMARSEKDKFETWLGSIIRPNEPFYVAIEKGEDNGEILQRIAKIGYEKQLKGVFALSESGEDSSDTFELEDFKANQNNYTVVDIRNHGEVASGKIFETAIAIPLNELRERTAEIPQTKPIVVHCAGGYRSTAGSSILENALPNQKVFDMGADILKFK